MSHSIARLLKASLLTLALLAGPIASPADAQSALDGITLVSTQVLPDGTTLVTFTTIHADGTTSSYTIVMRDNTNNAQ